MSRLTILESVLKHAQLVTPSPIAIRVVNVASKPDCTIAELADILSLDPVLCGKVLRVVNSCAYGGRGQPIASLERAVMMLGLNTLRSLVLGLSLPIAQAKSNASPGIREFWLDAVCGGILAKEFSIHRQGQSPGYDLVTGLLRDLGVLLLSQHNPAGWKEFLQVPIEQVLEDRCAVEESIFGIDHVQVTTALLKSWKLPDDVVIPIRLHHNLTASVNARAVYRERAELLCFVEWVLRLDDIVESPRLLKSFLSKSLLLLGMGDQALTSFLSAIAPKIEEVKPLFDLNNQENHDYAAILTRGCEALVELSLHSHLHINPVTQSKPGNIECEDSLLTSLPVASKTPTEMDYETHSNQEKQLPSFQPSFLSNFPEGGFIIDNYEVRSELGRGAMGLVYAGFDRMIHREVAIKMMSPEFAATKVARLRFQREARALAAVHHPNVLGIYSIGNAGQLPYLAMEFIHGGTIEELVKGVGPLPVDQIIAMGMQMALGLNSVHQKGILHRDIKPANIFIEAISHNVKIGDFGLATGVDNLGLTEAGTLVGSPMFMSPEQIEGHDLDSRSDLFSLGSVFYYMATALFPFAGKTFSAVVRQICDANPIPPIAIRRDLPEWLNDLILEMLTRDITKRVSSAMELHERLRVHQRSSQTVLMSV